VVPKILEATSPKFNENGIVIKAQTNAKPIVGNYRELEDESN